jgi:hypothetical protein
MPPDGPEPDPEAPANDAAEAPAIDAPKDVPEVVVSLVTTKKGEFLFAVNDESGNRLQTFSERHIRFELIADAQSLQHWISGLKTEWLPGLLSLLGHEVNTRGE